MVSRDEIESIVRTELERALERNHRARDGYHVLRGKLAQKCSSCAEAERLQKAAEEELAAREELWKAIEHFTEFAQKSEISADEVARQEGDAGGRPEKTKSPPPLRSSAAGPGGFPPADSELRRR